MIVYGIVNLIFDIKLRNAVKNDEDILIENKTNILTRDIGYFIREIKYSISTQIVADSALIGFATVILITAFLII
jgi:hypothetical protein